MPAIFDHTCAICQQHHHQLTHCADCDRPVCPDCSLLMPDDTTRCDTCTNADILPPSLLFSKSPRLTSPFHARPL